MKHGEKGQNLGMIQISPQVASDGSLSIVYLNGDQCKGNKQYSTRIIFQCAQDMVSVRMQVYMLIEIFWANFANYLGNWS